MAKHLELELLRNPDPTKGYTAGRLYLDGQPWLYTLEDEVRAIPGRPVSEWKIPKVTAIPRGRYRVILTRSNKFKRVLPEVLNVPGYTGIRMHKGNLAEHTEGCILVGKADGNDKDAWLGNSGVAEGELVAVLNDAINSGRQCWLTVR
jgi:hypothetical protein